MTVEGVTFAAGLAALAICTASALVEVVRIAGWRRAAWLFGPRAVIVGVAVTALLVI